MKNLFKAIDPTKEPILKSVIYLSIPMMFEMLAQNFFNLVDVYFVSKISYLAIGALVSCSIILMVMYSFFIGISTSSGIFIASSWGARKFLKARFYYINAFSLVAVSSLLFSLVLFLSLPKILALIGLTGSTETFALQYMKVASMGLFFIFFFSLNNSTLRSIALPTLSLKVMILANILNTILDPLFIFYFGLGMKGAALATLVSLSISISLQLLFLRKYGFFPKLKFKKTAVKQILNKGIYASMHLFFRITSMLALIKLISSISEVALSAYSTVVRIFQLLLFLVFGLANTAFVIVGQNYGAKYLDRARKGAFLVIFFGLAFVGTLDVLIYIFKCQIISVFLKNPDAKLVAQRIVVFYFLSYPFVIASTISARASMALQDTKRPSLINLLNLWFFMLPLAWFLSKRLNLDGIWLAIAISNFTSFIANTVILIANFRSAQNETIHI